MNKMEIGNKYLRIEDFHRIVYLNEQLTLYKSTKEKIEKNYSFLKKFSDEKIIYGINTGFGPMAQYKINDDDKIQLQYNLIRSHCSGAGQPLKVDFCKAALLTRLNSFLQAKSGIHISLVELMIDLINKNIIPVIYKHGGVGASGDLVQLAHMALALIGEGEVYVNGEIHSSEKVFKTNNIQPLQIQLREALALMNGTSVMTGIGALNLLHSKNLLEYNIHTSAWLFELIESYDDYYSEPLNEAKLHHGQKKIASRFREILNNSIYTKKREEHLYKKIDVIQSNEKVQEFYSIRCTPQILGPIYDTLEHATQIIENEINSANDNPVVSDSLENVYHGGNFHGDYISLEMDKVKITLTRLSMLMERQINFLMNSNLNGIFPPFLNKGTLGFNFGIQGIQFTATSTTAECQTLAFPMYVHSIPNNNDNQDIVSMGTNAAIICAKVIENTYQILSIELVSLIQASNLANKEGKLSHSIEKLRNEITHYFTSFTEDTPSYKKIEKVKLHLQNNII
jgi:histidine ammonia-lyase